jgi:hypothetical protein
MKRNVKKYEGRRKNGSEMPQNNCGRLLKFIPAIWVRYSKLRHDSNAKRDRPRGVNPKNQGIILEQPLINAS